MVPSTLRKLHIALGDVSNSNNLSSRIGATFSRNASSQANLGVNNTTPEINLSVVGSTGIGVSSSSSAKEDHSIIKSITDGNEFFGKINGFGLRPLFPNGAVSKGVEISTPNTANGGSMLMVINTDTDKHEAFSIVQRPFGDSLTENNLNNTSVLATFQASGKVGIGTNFPTHEGLTIQQQLSIKSSTPSNPFEEITKTLVADSTGLVKEVVAAPVPVGGIIMWSGDTDAIPEGWRLCNGDGGTPNLSNKFIIASNNESGPPTTTILSVNAASTGGSTSFTPEGTLTLEKLLQTDIAPHHHFFLADDRVYNNLDTSYPDDTDSIGGPGSSSGTAATGVRTIGGYDGTSDYSGNRRVYATSKNSRYISTNSTTVMQTNTQTRPAGVFTGTTAAKAIIPPFYALAYIIYVGV